MTASNLEKKLMDLQRIKCLMHVIANPTILSLRF